MTLDELKGFTPGPWEVSHDAVPEWHMQFTIFADGDGKRVATAFGSDENAQAISAVPGLIELAKLGLELAGQRLEERKHEWRSVMMNIEEREPKSVRLARAYIERAKNL